MKKKIIFIALGLMVLLVTGCGKNNQIKTDLKLTKVSRYEKLPVKQDRDEAQNLFEELLSSSKKNQFEYKVSREVVLEKGNLYEDEIIKIDFKYVDNYIESIIENKSEDFFYIDWRKSMIKLKYLDDKKKPKLKRLIRLEKKLDPVEYIQKSEIIEAGSKEKLKYTSIENVKTLTSSGISEATLNYWLTGKLLSDNVSDIELILELKFNKYDKIMYKFIIKKI